jgi:glucans biosynthesis protein
LHARTTAYALLFRAVLPLLVCSAAIFPAQAQNAPNDQTFSAEYVVQLASELAKKPFAPPKEEVPNGLADIGYDKYRDIRFRPERAIWRGQHRNFELHFLPAAWIYKYPITVNIVTAGVATPVKPDRDMFDFGKLVGQPPADSAPIKLSGFRINGPINQPGVFDEIVVFQGASYFRGISRGQTYGLSARGLAIDTGEPSGEEFPFFSTFWIETPARSSHQLVVHALLDSPSATGAYRFVIKGGAPTTVDVDVKLFPRRDVLHVGVAPLTSMFLFSSIDRTRINDFRSAVHDSDGLLIENWAGERIWRPLANPKRLQVSIFSVRDLKAFGLLQRDRRFSDYGDLEANYEQRPSGWIEPNGSWGDGSVQLFEIPSEEEIHDNIVAFWRPLEPYSKDQTYSFGYRISWPNDVAQGALAAVRNTASGLASGPERKNGAIRYAVDFSSATAAQGREPPQAALSATSGKVSQPVVEPNPHTHGWRVNFVLTPGDSDTVEMRLELRRQQRIVSEVWLFRWTK